MYKHQQLHDGSPEDQEVGHGSDVTRTAREYFCTVSFSYQNALESEMPLL